MHKTRQPLCTWLWAAFLVTTDKRGISAVQLQKQLGIRRYETAFNMLHKLRAAMVNPDRVPLSGTVEVDETYIGGPERGKPGRGAFGKALVVGAVEVRGDVPVRVRFRKIPSASATHLMKFITDNVATAEPDAEEDDKTVVITDGSLAYEGLYGKGYIHRIQSTGMFGDDPDTVLPRFHLAVSNLKRWLLGTHHGAVSHKHLQAYLNEFAFRYNRRRNLWAAFQTLLGLTAKVEGPTYEGLYKGTFRHKNPVLTGYKI
jgi:transposase-like protein